MELPETNASAPAFWTSGRVADERPPSTSSQADEPILSNARRRVAIFGRTSGMNFWPEKPGLTVNTSTTSTSDSMGSIAEAGVAGFSVTPALHPSDLICWMVRCKCGQVSTCTVMCDAPALIKASM